MLTFFKQIFVWWNQQTLGTRIQTILFGKFVGKDSFGNKYYENKNGKRSPALTTFNISLSKDIILGLNLLSIFLILRQFGQLSLE